MTNKNEIIKNAYISYGFPGESRLFTLLSKDHKEITKEDIKNFLGHQEAEQIYKPHINPRRSKQGFSAITTQRKYKAKSCSYRRKFGRFGKILYNPESGFCCTPLHLNSYEGFP